MQDKLHIACPACRSVNRVAAARLADAPRCGKCKQALFDGHPVALGDTDFEHFVGRTDLPVIVDFWAPWCGPCRTFAPTYEQAARELEPRVRLAKLDTEANPATAQRHAIRSIPTLLALRGGREVDRISGALPLGQLLAWARRIA